MVTNNAWNSQDPAQIAKGGTGRATITAFNVVTGDGTNPVNLVAPSATSGVPLISQGAASQPAYGTAVVAGGGTGRTTLTAFTVLTGDGTNQVNLVAPSATSGVPLISQGAASQPAFGTAVVAGGGTGITSATAYAVLCGGTTSTNPFQSIASVGTAGQVLTSNGAGALPTFENPSGATGVMVQQVRSSTNSNFTTTTQIPTDNTIPQITEGAELLTAAITPLNAANTIVIDICLSYTAVTNPQHTAALFVDATANAIAAFPFAAVSGSYAYMSCQRYFLSAGSTSARTYRLRVGPNAGGGTTVINPAYYSTAIFTSMTVSEIT